ncbi:hypothetical protein GALMADRAFT_609979 [Galerina marginata CBS 339.88]|uniref:Uncharacterized protein n=1 Tax=Galerina marginata (strain CBS 339.88) TaxID=685588 RepID=A0A067T384_GALM3|nr:hypothetical protein GALMADRAFT_609979 [Galerina marginata CBS 339.88]
MHTRRELFGGAITAGTIPDLIDAANLRQVPDTQEVFMYPDSNISIIVEILQRVESSHYSDAIRFHFDSLAHDNSARSAEVESVSVIPNDRGDETPSAIVLKGIQFVPKFNHTTPDKVQILMALFRVESKHIDLAVTFNIPIGCADGGAVSSEQSEKARADFDTFVRTFRIVDFGLFA